MPLAVFLAWHLALNSPAAPFDARMDRLKVFYAPSTWRRR